MAMQDESELLRRENVRLRSSMKERYRFGNIIGKSAAMQEVYDLILKAGATDASVVIYGESGTGKELVARTIHEMSDRKHKAFVPVNCGAIPETLFESELFGHRKGAFTGAHIDKHGFFDLASRGTLFLDEIGELSPTMQVKLLRAVEGGGYTPVGDTKTKKADVRIVVATNRHLMDMLRKGLIREDFLYRIHVIPVTLPPLRDRKEDIVLLVDHFLKLYGNGKERPTMPGRILNALYSHDWPGNIRELENVLKRYLTTKRLDFIGTTHEADSMGPVSVAAGLHQEEGPGLRNALEAFEKEYISKLLARNQWHRTKTAAMLRIPERTLYRKLKQFQLTLS
jgi:transcriptional regulator with PAS, ATPase and Fis domain